MFVSIYESGSTDQTQAWLRLLRLLLLALRVPHYIMRDGSLRKRSDQVRPTTLKPSSASPTSSLKEPTISK